MRLRKQGNYVKLINPLYCFLLVLFYGCQDCEDTTEPILLVHFNNFENYTRFYGIGGRDTLPMTNELPLAINSDTSIYILFQELKIDTLGISYNKTVNYQSDFCGFSIELDDFKLLDISTFDSARFIINNQTETNLEEDVAENKYQIILY